MVLLMPNHCNTCPTHIRGLCCYKKRIIQHSKTNWSIIYHSPCKHLNTKSNRCKMYNKRHENKHCLTIEQSIHRHYSLPFGCKYIFYEHEVITQSAV